MKNIRKIVSLVLVAVFMVAVAIGVGITFSVKNINVSYESFTSIHDKEFASTKSNFEKLKGVSMFFLNEDDVNAQIASNGYVYLVSFEKVYPCSINIALKERNEFYAYAIGSGYDMYSDDGVHMRSSMANVNPSDNSPNVVLNCNSDDVLFCIEMLNIFKNEMGMLRNYVKDVVMERSIISRASNLTVNFYSGTKIIIADYTIQPERKMQKAVELYKTLTEKQLMGGAIMAYDSDGTLLTVDAVYYN